MITCNVEDLIKDLEKLHKDVTRRLEQVVAGFAYEFTLTLGNNTPVSDEQSIARYSWLYAKRLRLHKIDSKPGYHSGSWQVSSSNNFEFSQLISDPDLAANDASSFVQQYYKLGEPVYVGANTPGMEALEFGSSDQAPDGIADISVKQVMNAYSIDVLKYYNQ